MFKGSQGFELKNPPYQPVRNDSTVINGREYSRHALDQMQNRGLVPSVVENTIQNGSSKPGNKAGATAHYDEVNNTTVITNAETGKVITTRTGK
ncbi:DUF4258 domain-containing protein [bacterium]|nr:DUF4258 domain-containing protein [bacterium]